MVRVPQPHLVILTALKMEARAVADALHIATPRPGQPVTATVANHPVQLHLIGIGARKLPANLSPETASLIMMAGLAGGLDPGLRVGDIVIDDASTWLPSTPSLRCLKCHTAPEVVSTVAAKADLFRNSGAGFVDMESATIRETAARLGIPYIGVRAISDGATDAIDPAALQFIDPYGNLRLGEIATTLLQRPGLVTDLLRFSKASKQALAVLAATVRQLVTERASATVAR
jgi:adenosylhomocysteine nucleosidase